MDYVPTPEQIERGLTDEGVSGFARSGHERMDFIPTPGQVERGLTDGVSGRSRCLGAANGLCPYARAGGARFDGWLGESSCCLG
jgi:hypothetical protein